MTRKTTDLLEIIKKRYGIDPRTDERIQQWAQVYHISQLIYDARQAAGLSQQQLAEKIGESLEVVESLEAADYEGDAMAMLRKVADALGQQVEIRLVPNAKTESVG